MCPTSNHNKMVAVLPLVLLISATAGMNSSSMAVELSQEMQVPGAHVGSRDGSTAESTIPNVSGRALPKDVNVCVGEGVRMRATEIIGDLKKCGTYSPTGVYFNLLPTRNRITASKQHRKQGAVPIYWDSGNEGERCGFRIDGITMAERGSWLIEVESSSNKTQNMTVHIYPYDCGQSQDQKYIFNPGQKLGYSVCGDIKSKRCLLRKPGEDEKGSPPAERNEICSLEGTYPDSTYGGVWSCDYATDKSLKKRSSKMTLTQKPIISTKTIELAEEVAMLCKYNGPFLTFQTCRWVKPGGKEELYPQDGLVFERYAYYGSGLVTGNCGLSIRKPIEEGDKGVWRCEMYEKNDSHPSYGAYVELGIAKRSRDQKLSTLRKWAGAWKKDEAIAVVGQPLTVGCSLYSSLSFCQIIHPNGTVIEPVGDLVKSYGSGNGLGDCGITLTHASTHDSGTWKCNVGVEYGNAVTSLIDVKVYGSELEAVNWERSGGGGVTLRCETVFGLALEHCRFQKPDGSIFVVSDKGNSEFSESLDAETGFEAIGNFSEGVCSVTLGSTGNADVGVWRCIGRIAGHTREISASFTLRSTGVSGASVGVITTVVVLVVILAGAGGIVFIRRRQIGSLFPRLQRSAQHSQDDRRGSEEDEAT